MQQRSFVAGSDGFCLNVVTTLNIVLLKVFFFSSVFLSATTNEETLFCFLLLSLSPSSLISITFFSPRITLTRVKITND